MKTTGEQEKILLASVPGMMLKHYLYIMSCVPDGESVLDAVAAYPELTQNMGPALRKRTLNIALRPDLSLFAMAEQLNVTLLTYDNPDYPRRIAELNDAPPLLYVRGSLEGEAPVLAVVGSRKCTAYGCESARVLAKAAAQSGITVISGLARGIDAGAHWGAIEGSGHTVAVLGTGIDRCYPAENAPLYQEILSGKGALVSEQPFGTAPYADNFPKRNRLITALADLLLVVEAGENSGALITCRHAQHQGLPVAVVPGNIGSPYSAGSNRLLRDGASIVTCPEDVMRLMGVKAKHTKTSVELTPDEQTIVNLLLTGDMNSDEIAHFTGFSAQNLACLLTSLELRGIVYNAAGGILAVRRDNDYIKQKVSEEPDGSADS